MSESNSRSHPRCDSVFKKKEKSLIVNRWDYQIMLRMQKVEIGPGSPTSRQASPIASSNAISPSASLANSVTKLSEPAGKQKANFRRLPPAGGTYPSKGSHS